MTQPQKKRNSRMHCPVCGETAHIRTSRRVSNKSREFYFQCVNEACSQVFAGILEVTHSVGDSLLPPEERKGSIANPCAKGGTAQPLGEPPS